MDDIPQITSRDITSIGKYVCPNCKERVKENVPVCPNCMRVFAEKEILSRNQRYEDHLKINFKWPVIFTITSVIIATIYFWMFK